MKTENTPLILTQHELEKWPAQAGLPAKVALDLEANSLHVYPEQLCLIQLSTSNRCAVIDPLLPLDLSPLLSALQPCTLVLHGADYDLRLLFRHLNFSPETVFDTMTAARLCGFSTFGLADLAWQLLGVRIDKSMQRIDWARRPLSPKMLFYAVEDTRHLLDMAEILESRLNDLGRGEWHRECCHQLVVKCRQPEEVDADTCWRVRGSGRLSPPQLALLREFWHWREKIALERRRPPYFVLSHESLIQMACSAGNFPSKGHIPPLSIPAGMPNSMHQGLMEAFHRVRMLPAEQWPKVRKSTPPAKDKAVESRLEKLEDIRNRQALRLGIDPSLIANQATLVRLARDWEGNLSLLLQWQHELLTDDAT